MLTLQERLEEMESQNMKLKKATKCLRERETSLNSELEENTAELSELPFTAALYHTSGVFNLRVTTPRGVRHNISGGLRVTTCNIKIFAL